LLATLSQWLLERAALLTPMMATNSNLLGGLVLIATGLFQWTSLKQACLNYCRSPLIFIQDHGGFQRTPLGSLGIGFRHGVYCVGCCWALMALLFVGGVMNVIWIALLTIFVLLEKVIPGGRLLSRIAGAGLIVWGMSLARIALAG
jgi:predicted metal-binding membrane protein